MHVVFSSFQKTSKNPGHRLIFMIQGRVIWLSPTRTAAWLFFCNFLVSPLFSALLSLFLTWVHPSSLPKRKKKTTAPLPRQTQYVNECWGARPCAVSVSGPRDCPPLSCCADPSLWWEVVRRVELSGVWGFVFSIERLRVKVSIWVSFLLPRLPSEDPRSDSSHATLLWFMKFTCQSLLRAALACELSAGCECSLCVCVCLPSKYVSVWRQMWLIFLLSSHKLHIDLFLAGCTDGFHRWLPEGGINAVLELTNMMCINMCAFTRDADTADTHIKTINTCGQNSLVAMTEKNRKQLIKIRYIIEINGKEITGNTKIMDSKILES